MKILLMGPPGCGKGTQAERLVKELGLTHLATGDLLRTEVAKGSEIGNKASEIMKSGALVPDELIIQILRARLEAGGVEEGIILDGFPRTVEQAHALDHLMAERDGGIDKAFLIDVDDAELISRISGRFSCASCGAGYHDRFKKPRTEGVCDACGATEFVRRPDDNPQTVAERLKVYHKQTAPIADFYEKKGILVRVDGEKSIDDVYVDIRSAV